MDFRSMYKSLIKQNIKRYSHLLRTGKPIFVMGRYGEISELFHQHNIPVYESFERMAKAFMGLYQYTEILKRKGLFEEYQRRKIGVKSDP